MKRAYVDSCIWITRFEGKSAYKNVIEEHLMRLAADGWEFCASDAVFLEALVKPLQEQHAEEAQKIRAFLETLHRLKTHVGIFIDAALRIAQRERLKAIDAIHIAFAQHHQCELFVSSDPHFRSLKTLRPYWIDLSGSAPSE